MNTINESAQSPEFKCSVCGRQVSAGGIRAASFVASHCQTKLHTHRKIAVKSLRMSESPQRRRGEKSNSKKKKENEQTAPEVVRRGTHVAR